MKQEIRDIYIKTNQIKLVFNIAYGYFKDLNRRTDIDKLFCDKAINVAQNQKYDGYQHGLGSMVYNVFDEKLLVGVLKMEILLTKYRPKNYTYQLLENVIKEKYTHLTHINEIVSQIKYGQIKAVKFIKDQ